MGLTRIRAEQISDIDYKQAVRVITVANVTLSGGAPDTVDGVTLVAGDRILVAGQSTGSQNGLYDVATLGTGSNGTWARTADGDVTGEIQAGMIVMVTEGDTYKDSQWKLTTNNPIVVGTTALVFEQNTGLAFGNIYANGTAILSNTASGTVTLAAGDNIAITGNNTTKTVTIGVVGLSLNSISNGTSNVNVVSSGGNVTVGVGGTSNIAVFSTVGLDVTGSISTTGNITANYFIGNGSQLTGISTSTNKIFSGTSNVDIASANANVTIGVDGVPELAVFSTSGLAVAGNVTGNGIPTTTVSDTAPANPEQGDIWIVGNTGVQLIYFTSSGNSQWAEMEASQSFSSTGTNYGNTEVAAYLPTYSGNIGDGTGYVFGNGSQLTGLPAGYTDSDVANVLADFGSNSISTSGNITSGNITISGLVTATGNVTGDYILGNGALLTGVITSVANINSGNSNVTVVSSGGNVTMGVAGTSNTAVFAQTSTTFAGNVLPSANITYNLGSATQRWNDIWLANSTIYLGSAQISANATALTLTNPGGGTTVLSGASPEVSATTIRATGNIDGGNLRTQGLISATGNITGNYILGNGSQLTGITGGSTATNGIFVNTSNVAANYTIDAGTNGMSVGPMTVNTGVVMAVATGQRWVIL